MSPDPTVVTKEAPEPRGPYVHARQHGGLVYVTAQIGRDPKTGDLVEGGLEAQLQQAIDNLDAILEDCDSSLDRVIRTQIMYTDPDDADMIDAVCARRFHAPPPVRTAWGVKFLAAEPGSEVVRVQIDCAAELR